ncbi:MAG: helix-turn-helix domain-containing protein [Oscillospiraceae bacterium]|nr:helix-turn-helix domain-containing protein [Oscillospiraceae bacterium]
MQKLTQSQLNYMLCIRALSTEGNVRATDISRQIGLSMPSVHHMLGTLENLSLVEKHRHAVFLTDAGREALGYYDIAVAAGEKLLHSIGITDCRDDAVALVTALSEVAVDKLIEKLM